MANNRRNQCMFNHHLIIIWDEIYRNWNELRKELKDWLYEIWTFYIHRSWVFLKKEWDVITLIKKNNKNWTFISDIVIEKHKRSLMIHFKIYNDTKLNFKNEMLELRREEREIRDTFLDILKK